MAKIYYLGLNMFWLVNGRTMNGPRGEWTEDHELFSEEKNENSQKHRSGSSSYDPSTREYQQRPALATQRIPGQPELQRLYLKKQKQSPELQFNSRVLAQQSPGFNTQQHMKQGTLAQAYNASTQDVQAGGEGG